MDTEKKELTKKQQERLSLDNLLKCNMDNCTGFQNYQFLFFRSKAHKRNPNDYKEFMVCGYRGQNDFCLYYPRISMVYFVSNVQICRVTYHDKENGVSCKGSYGDYGRELTIQEEKELMARVPEKERKKPIYIETMERLNSVKEEKENMPTKVEQEIVQPNQSIAQPLETAQTNSKVHALEEALRANGIKWRFVHGKCITARTYWGLSRKIMKETCNGEEVSI